MAQWTRNDEVAQALEPFIDGGTLAGVATLEWRADGGRHATCVGWRDREAGLPVERDTIFRVASMSKPITSVAALMLWEDGRFALDDPIARWAPEFAEMRVLRSPTAALDDTVPAERPITFEHLLSHRSGLTYGAAHAPPIAAAFAQALGRDIDSELAPDQWMAALATLPLIDQPGAALHYGHSTDLLGLLVARIAGVSLGRLLRERIFEPLGMPDTGFLVPPVHWHRRATLYGFDDRGALVARATGPGGSTVPERPADMAYESGGQGLWSTLDDYAAFARLFVQGGEVDGVRILRPETVRMMMTNVLSADQRARSEVVGWPLFASGYGFGLGVAVVMEPEAALPSICGGTRGAVGWPGGFGGWWRADPTEGSVRVFLAHNIVEFEQFSRGIGFGVQSAIARFQAASTVPGVHRPAAG
ncbi:MAG: serine hydrolase domain-containing protein [Vicinamibacterales bacterium]